MYIYDIYTHFYCIELLFISFWLQLFHSINEICLFSLCQQIIRQDFEKHGESDNLKHYTLHEQEYKNILFTK